MRLKYEPCSRKWLVEMRRDAHTLSLPHTHTHTHTHTPALSLAHTHTLSLSHTHTLPCCRKWAVEIRTATAGGTKSADVQLATYLMKMQVAAPPPWR